MARTLHFVRTALLLAAVGFLTQLASSAQAMNIYNSSSLLMYVTFNCGFFCGNSWTIDAGDMKSRPNESGNILASTGAHGCTVEVDTHGWVIATGTRRSNVVLTAYHEDGSVSDTCTFFYFNQPML